MDLGLSGKRVLVTGSTGGIGEGIAKRFAEEGAIVIINGRRAGQADRVASEIREAGGHAITAVGDLTQDEDVTKIIEIAQTELGAIDVLVNNAAGGGHQNDLQTPPSEWLESYNTNVLSMVRLIQKILPLMQEQGWGRIINIASAAGVNPVAGMGVYSTTKAAVINLTVTLARGIKGEGITINTVSPGAILTSNMIATGLQQGMASTSEEVVAAMDQMMVSATPLARMGRVAEVADVVIFLASPLAGYVHGTNICIDGGYVPTVN